MNEQATPQGTLGTAEIERLKKQHGRIYEVVVDDEGTRYAAYFRRLHMTTLAAMTDEVRTDAALFVAAVGQLGTVIGSVRAEIKNV